MKLSVVPYLFLIILKCSPYTQGTDLVLSSALESSIAMVVCTEDSDCTKFQNAKCLDSFCYCNGSRFCRDKLETKVTKLEERCQIDAECNIEHSVCQEKKCKCDVGRIGSLNRRKCLKVADGLGSTCEDSVQCYTKVPQSGCHDEKCACQQNTHEFNGTCFNDVGLGQKCKHLGQCTFTPFAKCIEETCTCKDGYVSNAASTKCLELPKRISDPCYEDVQCSTKFGQAVCKQGFCHCTELFQFKKSVDMCVRDLLLGETCVHHSDCHGIEEGESRLECILGECKCRSEFVQEQGFCSSAASALYHVPSILAFPILLIGVYYQDNIYIILTSLVYSIFYMLWITLLGRYFFDNNNYMESSEAHSD